MREFAFRSLGQPFEWGVTDCHALAVRALDIMTGQDYEARIRGLYTGLRGALRLVRQLGDFDYQLEREGGYDVGIPDFGDFVIYSRVDGASWWRAHTPALCVGGARVMLPLHGLEAVGFAPVYAIGRVHRVLRVPCLKPPSRLPDQ